MFQSSLEIYRSLNTQPVCVCVNVNISTTFKVYSHRVIEHYHYRSSYVDRKIAIPFFPSQCPSKRSKMSPVKVAMTVIESSSVNGPLCWWRQRKRKTASWAIVDIFSYITMDTMWNLDVDENATCTRVNAMHYERNLLVPTVFACFGNSYNGPWEVRVVLNDPQDGALAGTRHVHSLPHHLHSMVTKIKTSGRQVTHSEVNQRRPMYAGGGTHKRRGTHHWFKTQVRLKTGVSVTPWRELLAEEANRRGRGK